MTTHIYAVRPEREVALDVFSPEQPNGAAIMVIHGGGLLFGSKELVHSYVETLTAHRFTVVTPNYRLRTEVLWPAPLEDIKTAVAWVRDHAMDLKIDPSKIILEGFSAGAMLALLAGQVCGVAAVVAFFARSNAETNINSPMHLGEHLSDREIAASAPLTAIVPGYPPTMILHGMTDPMVPPDHALALFAKLREVGTKADLRLYHDHHHEFSMEPSMVAPVQNDVALFLKRAVVDTERYAEESRTTNPLLRAGPRPELPKPFKR